MARSETRQARSTFAAVLGAALSILVLAACSADDAAPPPGDPAPSAGEESSTELAAGEPMELSVLTYNIEYSGDKTTDAVIDDIDADVVGVLESYDRLPEIAERTGYPYYNLGLQLLSKYPIHEPSGRRRPLRPHRGAAGLRRRDVQHAPRLREVRPEALPRRDAPGGGAGVRGRGAHPLDRGADPRRADPARARATRSSSPVTSTSPRAWTTPKRPSVCARASRRRSRGRSARRCSTSACATTFREIHPDPVENPGLTHGNPDFQQGWVRRSHRLPVRRRPGGHPVQRARR